MIDAPIIGVSPQYPPRAAVPADEETAKAAQDWIAAEAGRAKSLSFHSKLVNVLPRFGGGWVVHFHIAGNPPALLLPTNAGWRDAFLAYLPEMIQNERTAWLHHFPPVNPIPV